MSPWGTLLFRRGEPSEGWLPPDGRFFSSPRGVGAGEGLGEFIREVYCSLASQPTSCGGVLIAVGEAPVDMCQPLSVILTRRNLATYPCQDPSSRAPTGSAVRSSLPWKVWE
jgi:hypothetical protein